MPYVRYTTVGAVVLAFILAAVLVRMARAAVGRLLVALDIASSENRAAVQARARQLIRALTLFAYGVAALGTISDATAYYWNPAALAELVRPEVAMDYAKPFGVPDLKSFGQRLDNTRGGGAGKKRQESAIALS